MKKYIALFTLIAMSAIAHAQNARPVLDIMLTNYQYPYRFISSM
ncbi:hypothetical protein [Olivibacter ginsenosidimutans]